MWSEAFWYIGAEAYEFLRLLSLEKDSLPVWCIPPGVLRFAFVGIEFVRKYDTIAITVGNIALVLVPRMCPDHYCIRCSGWIYPSYGKYLVYLCLFCMEMLGI